MKFARLEKEISVKAQTGQGGLADLGWVLVGGLLLLWLVILGEYIPEWAKYLVPLRIPLGLAYVLFVPGYLLQAALFPRRDDLDGVERLGLSLGLSVAFIPLLALLLDRLPWGLRLWPIVFGQALLVLILLLVALIRRLMVPYVEAYTPDLRSYLGVWWRGLELLDRRLFLLAVTALLFAGLAATWIFLVPSDAEFMTEFYLLGPEGLAEGFPRQAAPGQILAITLGVTNRERAGQSYRLEVWQVDPWSEGRRQLVGQAGPFALPVGETRQWQQLFRVQWAGQDQQFEFLLFTPGQPEPYRRLLLWVNIQE